MVEALMEASTMVVYQQQAGGEEDEEKEKKDEDEEDVEEEQEEQLQLHDWAVDKICLLLGDFFKFPLLPPVQTS